MENRRKYATCNIDVHRASYGKQLRSEKHLDNIKQDEIIIPERLFKEEQTPIKKTKKYIHP